MSYENPSFQMRAENVWHNVQKIFVGCCNCKKQIEELREEAAIFRLAQQENTRLLLDIKRELDCAHQERVKLQEAVTASAGLASATASAETKKAPSILKTNISNTV
jgi:hypothetical protein